MRRCHSPTRSRCLRPPPCYRRSSRRHLPCRCAAQGRSCQRSVRVTTLRPPMMISPARVSSTTGSVRNSATLRKPPKRSKLPLVKAEIAWKMPYHSPWPTPNSRGKPGPQDHRADGLDSERDHDRPGDSACCPPSRVIAPVSCNSRRSRRFGRWPIRSRIVATPMTKPSPPTCIRIAMITWPNGVQYRACRR